MSGLLNFVVAEAGCGFVTIIYPGENVRNFDSGNAACVGRNLA